MITSARSGKKTLHKAAKKVAMKHGLEVLEGR
jgi:hypothetical protein